MAGLFGTLQLARGALQAQQRGIQNASGNVANVNTPGYTRRTLALQSQGPELPIGGGVMVASETRTVDNFLRAQTQRASVDVAYANARETALSALENLRAPDGTAPIDTAITDFFNAMSALASDPSSSAQRTLTLQRAQDLSGQLNDEATRLTQFRQSLDTQLGDNAKQATTLAKNIVDLNKRITEIEVGGQEASTLRDQRDLAAQSLAQLTGGQVLTNSRGETSVLAFGTTIVDGQRSLVVSTKPNATTGVADIVVDGNVVTSRVLGGAMGAAMQTRDGDALAQQQGLDTLTSNIAGALNTLHQAGFGLDGVSGRALFSGTTAATIRVAITSGSELAASDSAATLPGNNVNALAMANAGVTTFGDQHRALIADLTTATQAARNEQSARTEQYATADAMEQSVSGVSTDDELTRLMAFQRGYQASAKVINTVNELFDTLMGIGGR